MNTRRQDGEEDESATISSFQLRIVQNKKKRRIFIDSDKYDWL